MANIQQNDRQMVVYPVDVINELIGILDKNIVVQGVGQIRAMADVLGILTNPYKQISATQLASIVSPEDVSDTDSITSGNSTDNIES